jgi:hypothetical protein
VSDSLILTENKEKLIVVKGLSNYMVVDTGDVLMICPRNEADFKNVITDLAVNELNRYQ